jgi:predicted solute-binding protein
VANKKLTDEQLQNFNAAIEFGITNIQEVINQLNQQKIPGLNASHYLSENIQYNFDDQKRQGLELFLNYLQTK